MAVAPFVPPALGETAALFLNPDSSRDPAGWHARMADLRGDDPMPFVDYPGIDPFWVLTRHADVFAVSRDNQRWHNTAGVVMSARDDWDRLLASGMPLPQSLVQLDGTKHRLHRKVTDDWFRPAAVGRRQPRIEEIADTYIAKMRELGGSCDFAVDIAQPYTLHVIMDIYGVPEDDEAQMMRLTQGMFGAADPEFMGDAVDPGARLMASVLEFAQYFASITEDRRACPTEDLASVIANAEIEGCPMGDLERFWYYVIVATAGHDTTSFGLAGGVEALMRDPSQWEALRADPDLVPLATDEVIRWTTPVQHFLRTAACDTEVGGQQIKAGDWLMINYVAANHDPAQFEDPRRFDAARSPNRHLAFGAGAHQCLGLHLARLEMRILFEALLDRIDAVELAGEPVRSNSTFVGGLKTLPLKVNAS